MDRRAISERQSELMVIGHLSEASLTELDALLSSIGGAIDDNPHLDFSKFETVHFMRFAILPKSHYGTEAKAPRLFLSTNYDGALDLHLDDLFSDESNAQTLCRIFGYCVELNDSPSVDQVKQFIREKRLPANAFYIGGVGRSVARIRSEAQLVESLQSQLDALTREGTLPASPVACKERLVNFVKSDENLKWALESVAEPAPSNPTLTKALSLIRDWRVLLGIVAVVELVMFGLLGWVGALFFPILLATILAYLRFLETTDPSYDGEYADPNHYQRLATKEDFVTQNQMTSLSLIKPQRFRLWLLKTVLGAINLLAKQVYNQGRLGDITSIHFARWVIIDDDRHLLFLSNYDGTWESYLGDFIDKAANGLTAIWSNTVKFPRATWLAGGGARHEREFKGAVRDSQVPTQIWYSAYPQLSINNVLRHSRIRKGLSKTMNETETQAWLRNL